VTDLPPRAGCVGRSLIRASAGRHGVATPLPPPPLPGPPFTLGVASGEPTADGVVLWTRLAPDPLVPGSGMPPSPYAVDWEVASDDRFRRVVRRGHHTATPEDGHSVHVQLHGLRDDATYFYRFRAGGEISPSGRTRTAPSPRQHLRHVRFATASCQNYENGFYNAHRALAGEDLAFVLFLGDYIYEGRPNATAIRQHDGDSEPVTLDEYRARHARYKSDLDLRVYRRFGWADLLQVDVLDTRQYRSDQPTDLAGANDPAATMLGADQERWLFQGLRRSRARWNVLAQQTMVAQNDRSAGPVEVFDFDNWDGYRVPRQRLLGELARVDNPVVVTGDRHATWIAELKQDFYDPASPTVAAELTGSSITSGGDASRESFHATYDPIKAESPHWKFIDNGRGYLLCDVDRHRMLTELRTVPTVRAIDPTVSTYARFVTEAGRPGVDVA